MSGKVTNDPDNKTEAAEQYYTGITLHHNNTATTNTQCQPSTTIRRSIRRYISASDRPTWMERGAVERKGLLQPAKGVGGGTSRAQGWTEMRLLVPLPAWSWVEATLDGTNIVSSFFSVLLRILKDISLIY